MKLRHAMLAVVALLMAGMAPSQAALVSRLSGQAYYDTVLDITWLADANLAASNTFGVTGIYPAGYMSWAKANEWIAAMNTANYLGVNDWRLPNIIDTGAAGCEGTAYIGTDCGYNVDLSTGEMAHMFYSTLGNTGAYTTSGSLTGCGSTAPYYCLTNTGPFSNLQPGIYWSGTTYAPLTNYAWHFRFSIGYQSYSNKNSAYYVWAVRPGDIAAVPVPAAVWMLGSALGVLGLVRRKIATGTGA